MSPENAIDLIIMLFQERKEKDAEIARLTSDRDAKSKRMWELGTRCDELEALVREIEPWLAGASMEHPWLKRARSLLVNPDSPTFDGSWDGSGEGEGVPRDDEEGNEEPK